MFSVPEGRPANQPLAETTFKPPIEASLPGARVSFAVIGSPASSVAVTDSGEGFLAMFFCSGVAGASANQRAQKQVQRRYPEGIPRQKNCCRSLTVSQFQL